MIENEELPDKPGLNPKPFTITFTKIPKDTTHRDDFINDRLSACCRQDENDYSMFYKNQIITSWSGKTVWKTAGHARLALNNIFGMSPSSFQKIGFANKKELIDYILNNNIVKIIKLN